MKNRFNILLIAFLLVFVSSCSKFAPLERVDDKGNNTMLKAGVTDGLNSSDSEGGITDPENDEDFDLDPTITDPEDDEDYDKENN